MAYSLYCDSTGDQNKYLGQIFLVLVCFKIFPSYVNVVLIIHCDNYDEDNVEDDDKMNPLKLKINTDFYNIFVRFLL